MVFLFAFANQTLFGGTLERAWLLAVDKGGAATGRLLSGSPNALRRG